MANGKEPKTDREWLMQLDTKLDAYGKHLADLQRAFDEHCKGHWGFASRVFFIVAQGVVFFVIGKYS